MTDRSGFRAGRDFGAGLREPATDESARDLLERLLAEQMVLRELIERLSGHAGQSYAQELPSLDSGRAEPARLVDRGLPPSARLKPPIAVFCLGTFRVQLGSRLVDTWRQTKALALFQYLVANHGRPLAHNTIIEALWPDPDALAAGSSLKVAVHYLRRLLAELGGDAAGLHVRAQGAGYQLCADELWLDVDEFEHAYRVGRMLEFRGAREQAVDQYTHAVNLYAGDFLQSSTADWAVLRRESLKDQLLFMLGRLADAAIARRDYEECIRRCQQLLRHDPCREDAYRMLMAAHSNIGQRTRVQTWYEVCRRTLELQLDTQPEPETDLVYRQALETASTPEPGATAPDTSLASTSQRTA